MKPRLPVIVVLLLLLLLLLLSGGLLVQEGQYELFVDGLACPFCAYGIEKQLLALEGVADVDTQIKEGAVVVTDKPKR